MDDVNGNDTYNPSHPAHALGHYLAQYLEHDVNHYDTLEHLEPEQVQQAHQLLANIRNAPYETVDTTHPSERKG